MKRKTIILAVVAAAAMAITLVGCGVKITNIAVPESAMMEKGESITLPVVYGTDDAPAGSLHKLSSPCCRNCTNPNM